MSFEILFNDLWVGDFNDKKNLTYLDEDENSHIHGRLEIIINGKKVPYLGHFGEDDVCFNEWCNVFYYLQDDLKTSETSTYKYDDVEQGQPDFQFSYDLSNVYFSITDFSASGREEDPEWSGISIERKLFTNVLGSFIKDFNSYCIEINQTEFKTWLKEVLEYRCSI